MSAATCAECGQPMLPPGAKKRPHEYDHASGCPRGGRSIAERVARGRELRAQLAESRARDAMRAAIRALDDMALDAFDREMGARRILEAALRGDGADGQ